MGSVEKISRVRAIAPEEATGEVAELFERQSKQGGRVSNFHMVMANAPAASIGWRQASHGMRWRYVKDDPEFLKLIEMAIVRTSAVNRGEYCLQHNLELGLEAGITEEQMEALQGDFEASGLFSDREKLVIRWAEAVTKMTAGGDDELFAELQASFDDTQIVELTALVGMWNWSNRFTEALHIEVEPAGDRLRFEPD